MTPIHTSVAAAFLDSGFRNAGTPLEMASMPRRATAPDENARIRSEQRDAGEERPRSGQLVERLLVDRAAASRSPEYDRTRPDAEQRAEGERRTRRSGPAKIRPDSFTPRRLAAVSSDDEAEAERAPGRSRSSGTAEVMAATPADTDTATVST